MKTLSLILVGALLLAIPSMVSAAIPLSVRAVITSGSSLGTQVLLKCKGYKVVGDGSTFDPWAAGNCTRLADATSLDFGTLITVLKDPNGTPTGGAGCFYGEDFFIVYLYPDAWGGAGYQISQSSATLPTAIQNAMVFTPVYASQDGYDINGDGDITDPGEGPQGGLNPQEEIDNPQLTPSVSKLASAAGGGLILKSYRPRIVRAQYGIPPIKADGTPWVQGWQRIPLTQTAGTYTATINITLTQI